MSDSVTPWTTACQASGLLQARLLEWVAISFSRGFFPTQGSNQCPQHWQVGSLPWSHQGVPSPSLGWSKPYGRVAAKLSGLQGPMGEVAGIGGIYPSRCPVGAHWMNYYPSREWPFSPIPPPFMAFLSPDTWLHHARLPAHITPA